MLLGCKIRAVKRCKNPLKKSMLKAQILAFTQPSTQDANSRQKQREAENIILSVWTCLEST